ncbi:protein THEMIS [Triplophysa dalaica]|uniref:protein THEMIS n=1 Tax=Triplophysa dalaica TaxID=1582913 RepID=UPI0024DFE2A8|nr:protein THEMIS [Triplophysa dalaica]
MALTLHEFTQCVNLKTLPRVLQTQSGIYCQGCVYEMFGRECSLSTGDLLKIIDITVTGFTAVSSSNTHIDLPLDYPGMFKLIADSEPYKDVEEIVESVKISSHRSGQPVFITRSDIQLPNGFVREREAFKITDVNIRPDGGHVNCELLHREPKSCFSLSFCQQGPFMECEDDQFYTLKEIADWKISKGRTRSVSQVKDLPKKDFLFPRVLENVCGELILTPVYELKAVTRLSQKVLLIPSNLDVEVMDVTGQFDCDSFEQHFSLKDVYKSPAELFPVVAELSCLSSFKLSPELNSLVHSDQVIIHHSYCPKRILASEMCSESPRHFLIPESYKGRLKRRPRRFPTAYDLERARSETEEIRVVATREFESGCDGLASVHDGDQFVVTKGKRGGTEKAAEAFECLKVGEKSQELEVKESVRLPMCLEGGFVELVSDKRQYTIAEICRWFPLPFNVNVSMRDLSLKVDILAGVPGLCIEEEISDPCLLVSTFDLSEMMEVPVNRTDLTLKIKKPWTGESLARNGISAVEEISEDGYFTLRRYAVATVTPPPRPPKKSKNPPPRPPRSLSSRSEQTHAKDSSCSPRNLHIQPFKREEEYSDSRHDKNTLIVPKGSPEKALAKGGSLDNISTKRNEDEDDEDDMHDYEYIDEDQLDNIRKTKPSNTI